MDKSLKTTLLKVFVTVIESRPFQIFAETLRLSISAQICSEIEVSMLLYSASFISNQWHVLWNDPLNLVRRVSLSMRRPWKRGCDALIPQEKLLSCNCQEVPQTQKNHFSCIWKDLNFHFCSSANAQKYNMNLNSHKLVCIPVFHYQAFRDVRQGVVPMPHTISVESQMKGLVSKEKVVLRKKDLWTDVSRVSPSLLARLVLRSDEGLRLKTSPQNSPLW